MSEQVKRGDWVCIHTVILPAGDRAPGIPPDTAVHPYQAWINGWATAAAALGETVRIRTAAGRLVTGTLVEAFPGYRHGFGRPHRALLAVGPALKRLLGERRD